MTHKILLVNGANLGCLGKRQPEIYGSETLSDIEEKLRKRVKAPELELLSIQSNHEGVLLDFLNQQFLAMQDRSKSFVKGIIINPGAFTHTSIALRDALEMFRPGGTFLYEVHLSNIHARESFRHKSFISEIATGVICGLGSFGYEAALMHILSKIEQEKT